MKLLFFSFSLSLLFIEVCEAQFGFGGFGGATQNCAGSKCNQNNFGKRKREILEEILALTEDVQDRTKRQVQNCQGSACNQNNLGGAAFGGFPAGFGAGFGGGAVQNCVGSQCNQNNGRRKRAIADAINELAEESLEAEKQEAVAKEIKKREAQVQNCQGSACNQNNLGGALGGFGGFPAGFGAGVGGGAVQNCVGSQCNQNNGRRKREITDAINQLTEEALEAEKQEALAKEIKKREAQVQNCQGSACNQNNLGGGFGGFGGFPGAAGGFGGASQNCVGSQCNQNNFGRKKREIVTNLLEEAHKIAEKQEAEKQKAEAKEERHSQEKREAQVQNCQGSACNQNNLGGAGFAGFGAGFPGVGGGFGGLGGGATQNCVGSQCNQNNLGKKKREASASGGVHILECSGSTSSTCEDELCTVQCSDGTKVELKCETGSVAVQSKSGEGDTSVNEVTCGSDGAKEQMKPLSRSCFPFC